MANPSDVEKLKLTKYYEPTLKRWRIQEAFCAKNGAPIDSFELYATEVVNTLEEGKEETVRDMLGLNDEKPAPYEPPLRYRQYESPIVAEMGVSLHGGKRK